MKRTVPLLVMLGFSALLLAPTFGQGQAQFDPKLLDAFTARNIGPANMSGRIVDVEGVESDPKTVYVAAASGGLWKTTDRGDTWKCVFDQESSVTIGDVAVSLSNPNVVWVGTGEHNLRNSVSWGDGVYKSTDGGQTWKHMGLKDSHSTGRIAIHTKNPDIVYVGVLGHAWGPNKERGVFKTTDGGKTWQPSLFIDEDTGIVDMRMDPNDPDTLYACAYCVRRTAFSGGNPGKFIGPKAGMYKTSDGGKRWEKLTVAAPNSQYGRCGIDIYRKNPNIVYAVVQTEKTKSGNSNEGNSANGNGGPDGGGIFRSDDRGKTWKHVNTLVPRPFYYGQIRVDPNDDKRVFVLGTSTAISTDGGKTFGGKGKGKGEDEGGGGEGGFVPWDDDQGDQKKDDQKKDDPKKDDQKKGGKGGGGGGGTVHADHHAMWINPQDSNEVWLGTDGGVGISANKGQGYRAIRAMALAQFYGISVDMSKPYYVYGGLQDNGSWGGPSATYNEGGIAQNKWFSIGGGDGFHTMSDPTDPTIAYSESQWGKLSRVNVANKGGKGKGEEGDAPGDLQAVLIGPEEQDKKDEQKKDDPKKEQKKGGGGGGVGVSGQGLRFNWSTPMHMSPHDPKTIFYGSQYLHMSATRGGNWKQISPNATYGPDKGKVNNFGHTLFTIGESPKKKGVIWTGSDDGRIMVTLDGGNKWDDVSAIPGLPKDRCVSRVEPSPHDAATCYVSISRYRNDDRKSYVYKTTDYGKTWMSLGAGLTGEGSTHCVHQSSKNKDLLFVGTELGLYASLDDGKTWHKLKGGLPTVSVHHILIHPRDRELVVGTHGRAIWIYDIAPLEEMTQETLAKQAHLFWVRPAVAYKPTPSTGKTNQFVGENPAYGAVIHYYQRQGGGAADVTISDKSGKEVAKLSGGGQAGLNKVIWNLRATGGQSTVPPGEYTATLRAGGQTLTQPVRVEAPK